MDPRMNRRSFLRASGSLSGTMWAADGSGLSASPSGAGAPSPRISPKFHLGMITYNVGATWDLPTLLDVCRTTGFGYVELRTSHAHKVEPSVPARDRQDIRKQFEDSGVKLWSFGTVCEFQATDPEVVKKNIEECRAFCRLAADVGAKGVKVRPNGVPKGADLQKTLAQIGAALRECGAAAKELGVEIWVEVHGGTTQNPPHMRTLMDACDHPSVGICWNSNPTDVKEGSIKDSFDLLKKDLRSCHINELWSPYPYRELFGALQETGYDRVTFMECAGVPEPANAKSPEAAIRFMRYYRALWSELCRAG
jgi:sugar phosphate isomerase/epimerase